MDLHAALQMARSLMDEHGLAHWRLALDGAKTRAGVCRPADLTISLSQPLTLLHPRDQVRDTVLHEIAHARAGTSAGHGAAWRSEALLLGCSATRCVSQDAPRVAGPWQGTCPAGHETTRHRRPTRVLSCSRCAPRFSAHHLVRWTYRGERVPMTAAYDAQLAAVLAGRPSATTSTPRLPVGTLVRLAGGGRFGGVTGVIAKQARTRYHVLTDSGLVTAPFALVEPAGAGPA